MALKSSILAMDTHAARLNTVFALAVAVYDDFEIARDFTLELHRGHTGMALGAPDMNTFVDAAELLGNDDGVRRVVGYLQEKLMRDRLQGIFQNQADIDSFMKRAHPVLGISPELAIRTRDNGYESVVQCLDRAEFVGYM